MNGNGAIDTNGTDRITRTVADAIYDEGLDEDVFRTRTYQWPDGSSTPTLISTRETSTSGLLTWSVVAAATNKTESSLLGGGYRDVISTAPDGSYTVNSFYHGRLTSSTHYDSQDNPLSSLSYAYDTHGRQNVITDARNGATTNCFNKMDQVSGTSSPSPDGTQSAQVTTNYFDTMGRITRTTFADGASVTNEYHLTGLLSRNYGARTYPVGYGYDAQGRMKTMTNWTTFPSTGTRVTTWNYDIYRGFMTNKLYADNNGTKYSYTPAGRLRTRVWARGITTTYTNNPAGDLMAITYSDSTPAAGFGYDRRGRQTTVTNAGSLTCTYTFNDANLMLTETFNSGPLSGISVTNGYDQFLRRTNLTLLGAGVLARTIYSYDDGGRLSTVSDGTNSATYAYLADSPLVDTITFKQNLTTRMTTTKTYDNLNRLTVIESLTNSSPVSSFKYVYNVANQRTSVTNVDYTYWVYKYDSLGQVISGKKYWSDGSPVAGQQFEYDFDDIGNRESTKSGGDNNGYNLRSATYAANNLNQYTSRTVPGYATVLGEATNTATVTVNNTPTLRKTNYFAAEVPVNNSTGAVYITLTNLAVLNNGTNADIISTNRGGQLIAKANESLTYDLDGNMTSDSLWTNVWNADNRAVTNESRTGIPTVARYKEEWTYLPDGRWIQRIFSTNSGSAWLGSFTNHFVWDGELLMAVLNHTNGLVKSFVRGLDLSGTIRGAGGAGGLLTEIIPTNESYFASCDVGGNVTMLVGVTNGQASTQFEYGPFGQLLRRSSLDSTDYQLNFSTQFQEVIQNRVKYLYRDYCTELGRWISRDPAGEDVDRNLFQLVGNNPVCFIDRDGRERGGFMICPRCGSYIMTSDGSKFTCPHCGYPGGPPPPPPPADPHAPALGKWCDSHPICCGWAHNGNKVVSQELTKRYGRDVNNTVENAVKHCVWMCWTASLTCCNANDALSLGKAYEDYPGNPAHEKAMDFHNNSIGANIGGKDLSDCVTKCSAAANNHLLYWFEPMNPTPPGLPSDYPSFTVNADGTFRSGTIGASSGTAPSYP